MSRENVEVVRAGFEAWSSGGVEALLELIDANSLCALDSLATVIRRSA
jgi:ketosteroid isomerase-like protein